MIFARVVDFTYLYVKIRTMKKRYKFTDNQWMIFDYQKGSTAIGYTSSKDSVPSISFVTDTGKKGTMPFDQVVNPRRLYIESRETNNIRKAVGILPDVMISFRKGEA